MAAIVLTGPGEFELQEVPTPVPEEDEVLCRVRACAICGTDPKIVKGVFAGTWPPAYPAVIGHEWCGEVVEVGAGVAASPFLSSRLGLGARVAGEAHKGCGVCGNCLQGRYTLCENYGDTSSGHRHYGFTAPGAYAEYVAVSAKSLHLLPEELSFDEGSMVDTAGVALQGVRRGRVAVGDRVVVLGPGPIGLFTAQYARAAGAEFTAVVGRGARLEVAENLGAVPVDSETVDPVERVLELTGGKGADVVIECAGTAAACAQSIAMTGKGGRLVMNGIPTEPIEIPWSKIVLEEFDMLGVRANPNTSEAALGLIANGSVEAGPILTHTFPLEKFGEALATFVERRDGALKVVVNP
ncbi:MAG: alcohol dehydrogenase catalytic domain-containing protein [Thermoleophilia bacterium]